MIVWMRRARARPQAASCRTRRPARWPRARRWRSSRWPSSPCCARASRPPSSCSPPSDDATDPLAAGLGAVLGFSPPSRSASGSTAAACASTSSRFFRVTGVVLVLVAAGLARLALHTAPRRAGSSAARRRRWTSAAIVRAGHGLRVADHRHARHPPEPTVIEVVGWLLYAIPMLAIVLWPTAPVATRPRDRATGALRGRRPPRAPLAARSSALAAAAARRRVHRRVAGERRAQRAKDGQVRAHRRGLRRRDRERRRAGRRRSWSSNKGTPKADEFEVMNADGIIWRDRERRAGPVAALLAHPPAGQVHAVLPRRNDAARQRLADRDRRAPPARSADDPLLARPSTATGPSSSSETAALVDRRRGSRAAVRARRLAEAKALFGPRACPTSDRAGRRDLRRPRPRDRRARQRRRRRSKWTGFHRIEQALWATDTTKGTGRSPTSSSPTSTTLDGKVARLKLEPAQLANGAVELLDEVSKSKITGEEERYSHTDLSDFQANVERRPARRSTRSRPALRERDDRQLVTEIDGRFAAVEQGLRPLQARQTGFVPYTELDAADRRQLAPADRRARRAAVAGRRRRSLPRA